jgi:hypothetical protein
MGEIVATCCHEITAEWMNDANSRVHVRTYDTCGNPAVSYEILCLNCLRARADEGLILKDEKEVNEFLGLTGPLHPATRDMTPLVNQDSNGTPVIELVNDEDEFVMRMSCHKAREMAYEIIKLTDTEIAGIDHP